MKGKIYNIRRWNGFRWHDLCTKFHDDRLRHLSNITVITATIWEAVMFVLLIERNYNVRRWDGFMWHDIHTKFQEDLCKPRCSVKVISKHQIPLEWDLVLWYITSFINVGSGIQELLRKVRIRTHMQQNDLISLSLFFETEEGRLKWLINLSKMWRSSNIWGRLQWIEIKQIKKSRTN